MRDVDERRGVRMSLLAWLAITMLFARSVAGQAAQTPARGERAATDAAVSELRELIERQRLLIEEQSRLLDEQSRDLRALRQQVDEINGIAIAARNDAAALKKQVAQQPAAAAANAGGGAIEQRLEQIEQSVQRGPELPAAVVPAGEFPGSIRIPGTDAAIKIGGQARMTLVHTLAALGMDDRFVTSSIPVEEQQSGEDSRTTYSVAPTRINIDLRSPIGITTLRTFIEADFAGSGGGMRLRHAYLQSRHWLVGQTWSTFSDPEAEPLGIDFEGLNAISLFRQPMIRFTQPLTSRFGVAFSLENPAPDLTGAQGVNLIPDFIARLRWEPDISHQEHRLLSKTEHVQAAILVRTLRGELQDRPDVTPSTSGFGVNVSGVLVPRWDADDRIKFASNAGWGIGRYITDLGTLGGQDAIYDPALNALRSLRVSSGYFGYERQWKPTFTSALTYGIVKVTNLDIQPGDALRRTQRSTINLTWSPIPQADLVLEFLAGTRVNKDGKHGSSSQIQAGWTFRF